MSKPQEIETANGTPPQSREIAVAHGVKWHKLNRPQPWNPTKPGAELVGYYLGQSIRTGVYGEYTIIMLAVPTGHGFTQPYTVSGVALINAIDGGLVEEGYLVRIVYQGVKDLDEERAVKLFDVYVGEGYLDERIAGELFNSIETKPRTKRKPRAKGRHCSVCGQPGHNKRTCPERD
jgi:hypothetical protein